MKPARHSLVLAATLFCAAIFVTTSAKGAENVLEAIQHPPNNPCNWTGFYLGINVGANWNHFDLGKQFTDVDLAQQFYEMAVTTFHLPGHSETDTGAVGGAQTGFKLQFGHIVLGIEGGFQGNVSDTQSQHKEFQENEIFLFTRQQFVTAETEFKNLRMVDSNWNGTIGGNIGFCWNRILFYVTGGAAFTDVHFYSMDRADTEFFGFVGDGDGTTHPAIRRTTGGPRQGEGFIGEIVSKHTHTDGDILTGYYAGGGTMYQLTDLCSVGIEYRHFGYGDKGENLMGGDGPVFSGNGNVGLSSDQVLLKFNIIVGPWGH
ncbi:MAG: hypothetical protein DME57_11425 [Verrucomicrobia bacterium]|nr:MAG: hypothetical protein DME57_11425 [Verrucomicrobiota bacterium]